jgi:hypothetical protein
MKPAFLILFAIIASCSGSDAPTAAPATIPNGATIEKSGFATILWAPGVRHPIQWPAMTAAEKKAALLEFEIQNVLRNSTLDRAAAKRLADQNIRDSDEAQGLHKLLKAKEHGNYISMRFEPGAAPVFTFDFRRDPEVSLRKYSVNPRFKTLQYANGNQAELEALAAEWAPRLQGIAGGGYADAALNKVVFDVNFTRPEFEALIAQKGWEVSPKLAFTYQREPKYPPIMPDAAPFVRIMPRSSSFTSGQLANAVLGRITLRDGCLYVERTGQPDALAFFSREMGLFVDPQGYLAIGERNGRVHYGRVGGHFLWGGITAEITDPAITGPVRKQCGVHRLVNVATPQMRPGFGHAAHMIVDYAKRLGVTREAAVAAYEKCWALQDALDQASRLKGDVRAAEVAYDRCRPKIVQ